MRVCKVVSPSDPHQQLDRFTAEVTEKDLLSMIAGERIALTNDGGDVLEAVGGVCHPWRQVSRAIQREKLAEFSKTQDELNEFRNRLQQAVPGTRRLQGNIGNNRCLQYRNWSKNWVDKF